MTVRYTTILERQTDGGYHVSCPALPGCHAEGDTLEDASENMREAMSLYVESLKAHGEPLPQEDLLIKSMDVAV